MSDHAWVLENIATYLAGGLDGEECDEFTAHIAQCADCARALADAQTADGKLDALFTAVRPAPTLEDRLIGCLREIPVQEPRRFPWKWRVVLGAAAAIIFAGFGAGLMAMMENEIMAFPGMRQDRVNATFRAGTAYSSTGFQDSEKEQSYFGVRGTSKPDSSVVQDAETMARELAKKLKERIDPTDTYNIVIRDSTASMGDEAGKGLHPPSRISLGTGTMAAYADPGWYAPFIADGRQLASGKADNSTLVWSTLDRRGGESYAKSDFKPSGAFALLSVVNNDKKPADQGGGFGGPFGGGGFGGPFGGGGFGGPFGRPGIEMPMPVRDVKSGDGEKNKKPPDEPPIFFPPVSTWQGQPPPPPVARKIIIRTGDIEFEVESFDAAAEVVNKLVDAIKGAFVATTNSEKLSNGKVRGSVVVRVPPEQLDKLILDLRKALAKTGDLKSQRIGSQDITKQYTDLESRLKAARTMEERLMKLIKDGKGEIKDLVAAEKELGVWRTKVEEFEGELRYYASQVALSTLTVTLAEKEIRTAAAVKETEQVRASIEVEDVEKAVRDVVEAVTEKKGRITKSETKQHGAGQLNAILEFEVAHDAAWLVRDRLKQLGTMVQLHIDRVQQTEGSGTLPRDGKLIRGDTQFRVSLYNLVSVTPRETVTLKVAATDVLDAYQKLREAVTKAKGRVLDAQLNEQDRQNIAAKIDFDVLRPDEGGIHNALAGVGEVVVRHVGRAAEGENVTDAKVRFKVDLLPATSIPPRETVTLRVAAPDVPEAYQKLRDAVAKAKGRVLDAQLNEKDRQNITAKIDFDIRRADDSVIQTALAGVGEVVERHVARSAEGDAVTYARRAFKVELLPAATIPPRETTTLALEVSDVEGTLTVFKALVKEAQGREVLTSGLVERNGQATSRVTYDVPFAAATGLVEKFKSAGIVRVQQLSRNQQAPEGKYAIARLEVTVSNTELLVPRDQGLWSQLRGGLGFSLRGLSISASWLLVGVLFVLPWFLLVAAIVWLFRRIWGSSARTAVAVSTPTGASAGSGG